MDVIIIFLSLLAFFVGLALLSNQARARQDYSYQLKPNCLLTRWPLLFVTGPRSIFYFRSYWNIYTSFLAEHGYEVFTLQLPWSNKEQRQKHFAEFIKNQSQIKKHFHLVVDNVTREELEPLLRELGQDVLVSITEISNDLKPSTKPTSLRGFPIPLQELSFQKSSRGSFLLDGAYKLHRLMIRKRSLPDLSTLGAVPESALKNSHLLLERAQTLAEMDLREDLPI